MKPHISGIVAADLDFLIGFNSLDQFRMPWAHDAMRDDMAFFRNTTKASWVIVGRKTLESIGRLLPRRFHVIFSRQRQLNFCGKTILHYSESPLSESPLSESPLAAEAVLVSGWQELEAFLAELPPMRKPPKLFLIGGAELFASAELNDLYLSIIEAKLKETIQPIEEAVFLPSNLCNSIRAKLAHTEPLQQIQRNDQNCYTAKIYHFTNLS